VSNPAAGLRAVDNIKIITIKTLFK